MNREELHDSLRSLPSVQAVRELVDHICDLEDRLAALEDTPRTTKASRAGLETRS